MLKGLGAIDWDHLTHAYGPAGDVPALLRRLSRPPDAAEEEDSATGEDPLSRLCNLVNHQTSVYPATPYVVPFLVELLAKGPVERRAALLYTLSSFAGYAGPPPPDPFGRAPVAAWAPDWDAAGCLCSPAARDEEAARRRAARADEAEIGRAMRAGVRAGLPHYIALLGDPDPETRQAAADAVAQFPEDARATGAPLAAALRAERDDRALGALSRALGRLLARGSDAGEAPDPAAVALLTDVALRPDLGPLARVQTAVALAPVLRERLPAACVAALDLGLDGPLAYAARDALLYLGAERGLPPLLRLLAAQCAAARSRWSLNQTMEALLDLAYDGRKLRGWQGSTGVGTVRYGPSTRLHRCEDGVTRPVPVRVAGQVELLPPPPVPPTTFQAQALRAILACDHFWAKPSNIFAMYGLPPSREGLRALLA